MDPKTVRAFTQEERIQFFRKKWNREHTGELAAMLAVYALSMFLGLRLHLLWLAGGVVTIALWGLWAKNRRAAYVEQHAFDGSGK